MAETLTRQTNKKGQVLLPNSFASGETEVRIRRAKVIAEAAIVFIEELSRNPVSDSSFALLRGAK